MSIKFTTGVDGYSTGTIVHTLPPSRETAYIQRGVAEVYAAPRLPLDAAELNDNIPRVVTDPITGAKSLVSGDGSSLPVTHVKEFTAASPALSYIAVAGMGFVPVALQVVDFAAEGYKVGDRVQITSNWNFPLGATNGKTMQWGRGPAPGSYTDIRARQPAVGVTRLKMICNMWIVSETFARTETQMYADNTTPYVVFNDVNTLALATDKLFLRVWNNDAANTATDSTYVWDVTVERFPGAA